MLQIAGRLLVLVVCCVALTPRSAAAAPQQDCVAWGPEKPDQLHCFWAGDQDGQLWHKGWWSGSWHTWQSLGKPGGVSFLGSTPDCLAWGLTKPDQLHCFIEDDAFRLWHIGWWDGRWHEWQDLGKPLQSGGAGSTPSCVAWGPVTADQIHCFVRGPAGKMWHRGWWNGAWQPWQDMGRPPGQHVDSRGPRCLAWGTATPNQLHCFTLAFDERDPDATEKTLWHRGWWDGAWHSWENLGKPANAAFEGQPECVAWGLDKPNQLHCFVTDSVAQRLWHRWWADGSWSGWQDLGGPAKQIAGSIFARPSCVAWGLDKPDQLHCFVDFDDTLWTRGWWDGAWHAWGNLGTQGAGPPECLAWGLEKPDQLHCFSISSTGGGYWGSLWHIGWWDGKWQPWQNLGHP